MIPASFEYRRPESLEEAFAELAAPGARPLAGGQALIAAMKRRELEPALLVALDSIPLAGIGAAAGSIAIGATTTWATVARDELVLNSLPALVDTAAVQGDRQVRNLATVGGGLASSDPRSDVWASAIALGSRAVVAGPGGSRELAAGELFGSPFAAAIGGDELITEVLFPTPRPGEGSAYRSARHPASHYPLAGATVRLVVAGGAVQEATVGLTGLAKVPLRLPQAERVLGGWDGRCDLLASLEPALAAVVAPAEPLIDPDHRRRLAAVAIVEAAASAFARAESGRG